MTPTSVNWRAMRADTRTADEVAALAATAAAFERDVPLVLMPVRLETRFTQVEVPDTADAGQGLVDALTALRNSVIELSGLPYATVLTGTVKEKGKQKQTIEQPMYDSVEMVLEQVNPPLVAAVDTALKQPLVGLAKPVQAELSELTAGVRTAYAEAESALAALRSVYQRDRLTALVSDQAQMVEPLLEAVDKRLLGLAFLTDLRPRAAAEVARSRGVDPAGRPLRADRPDPTSTSSEPAGTEGARALRARVVRADGTAPHALGARRAVPLKHAQLESAAVAAQTILDGAGGDTPIADLLSAAAAIPVLPGKWKARLLDTVGKAAQRRGELDAVTAQLATIPSDRVELDADVPAHVRDVVFEVRRAVHVEDRLLVRIYPEALAVDTFEEKLSETEAAAAMTFWTATAAAAGDRNQQLGAWRAICAGRGTRRAAWVAAATAPDDTSPTRGAELAEKIGRELDVLAKRLGEIGRGIERPEDEPVERLEGEPVERPGGEPVERPTVRPRLVRGLHRAADTVGTSLSSVDELPERSLAALRAQVETLIAAAARLTARGVDGAKEIAQRLDDLRERLDSIAVEQPPTPSIDPGQLKRAAWTRAPSSGVLPDRFAVVSISGDTVSHLFAGRPVPADLQLGLDPGADADDEEASAFGIDPDGNLIVPEPMRWMVDFDRAVEVGMAISLPIRPDEAVSGFDEVFVIGLAAGSADDGASRLERMFDAHHYTGDGIELLPITTPTNNTETTAAGFSGLDDPDVAFDVERRQSLAADTDGRALATALGINADHFVSIRGADGRDAVEARTATAALYPGTLGHALEELLPGILPLDARNRVRTFVTGHVSARGVAPAFRVADEPYGVLATTSLSLFAPHPHDGAATADGTEQANQVAFDTVMLGVLRQMHEDWSKLRGLVKHAHSKDIGAPGYDAKAYFLSMVGLQATSAEASYRFAVNVANRGGVRGRPDLSLSFGVPSADTADGAAAFGPFALMERFAEPLRTAFGLPAGGPRSSGAEAKTSPLASSWQDVYKRLNDSRAYALRHMDGVHALRGQVADAGTTAAVTALLASSATELATQARNGNLSGVPVAEILLRHALLAELRRAAVAILFSEHLADDTSYALAGASPMYQWSTIDATIQTSSWGFLFARLTDLDDRFGIDFPPGGFAAYMGGRSMEDYLAARGENPLTQGWPSADHRAAIDVLQAHAASVQAFGQVPVAHMSQLVREHLDLCTYRLDAWLSGLANRRLASMAAERERQHLPRRGAQLGAYGWLENVKPDPEERDLATLPPSLAGRPGRPVTVSGPQDVFIQTPSPTHAVTAAILRSGYVSQSGEGDVGNEMSVNLTSNRVRTALTLVDGVRAGNDLGALLGYRFERFLHEYYARPDVIAPAVLDVLIAPLRRAFPTVAPVDPDAATSNPAGDGTYRERYVVDGLALVRTALEAINADERTGAGTVLDLLRENSYGAAPWGIPDRGLPTLTPAIREGLARGIDDLANALDALSDLTTSEAVHQIVNGNHARAAAILAALAEGKAPESAQIAQTPRSGLPVNQRVVLQLPPVAAAPLVSPAGWDDVPVTPRAALEPSLNAWLAGLLGDPAQIRLRIVPKSSDQAESAASVAGPIAELSVAELGLQPLDLLAIVGRGFEGGLADLTARALDHRRPLNLEPDQPGRPSEAEAVDEYRIDPERAALWGPQTRSLADVSALLEAVHDLVGSARPVTARDYHMLESASSAAAHAAHQSDRAADAEAGFAAGELQVRLERLVSWAVDTALALARLLADDTTLDEDVLDGDGQAFVHEHAEVHLAEDGSLLHPDAFWTAREQWRAAVVDAGLLGILCAPPRRYVGRAQVCSKLPPGGRVRLYRTGTAAARCHGRHGQRRRRWGWRRQRWARPSGGDGGRREGAGRRGRRPAPCGVRGPRQPRPGGGSLIAEGLARRARRVAGEALPRCATGPAGQQGDVLVLAEALGGVPPDPAVPSCRVFEDRVALVGGAIPEPTALSGPGVRNGLRRGLVAGPWD